MQNVKVTHKADGEIVPARLFLLFARDANIAVIFRRGPSRWVQVVLWRTDIDTFEEGQWFHGRIYERRADLAPDGSLLIYFASKFNAATIKDRSYTYAWTAISKPPFLTALALWPKGDCWHGGGSFKDNRTVVLNHKVEVASPHPNHKPSQLKVTLKKNVHGEDDPIYSERLERDGWRLEQEWKVENRGYPQMFSTTQPEIRTKLRPGTSQSLQLIRSIHGLNCSEEFVLIDRRRSVNLDSASWADWDQQGRLVIAAQGRIYTGALDEDGNMVKHELLNLNLSKPKTIAAPAWAASW